MTREFSAGGIVFKKSKVLGSRSKVLWLVCQHSQHKGWVFPKGLIGDNHKGESSRETATREVKEETGVEAKVIAKLKKPTTYFYAWEGEKRFKTVYYFLMEYIGGDIKDHDFEMSEIIWLPTGEVEERLTYKSDKEAFQQALKELRSLKT